MHDAGTSAQSLSVLALSGSVDDTAWASDPDGAMYTTDNSDNTVVQDHGAVPDEARCSWQPRLVTPTTLRPPVRRPGFPPNYLGQLNPSTGAIARRAVVTGRQSPPKACCSCHEGRSSLRKRQPKGSPALAISWLHPFGVIGKPQFILLAVNADSILTVTGHQEKLPGKGAEAPVPASTDVLAGQVRRAIVLLWRQARRQAPSELTIAQLSALATAGVVGAIGVGQLAESEALPSPAMTRPADKLEEAGLPRAGSTRRTGAASSWRPRAPARN